VKDEAKKVLTTSNLSSPAVTKSLTTVSSRPTFSLFYSLTTNVAAEALHVQSLASILSSWAWLS